MANTIRLRSVTRLREDWTADVWRAGDRALGTVRWDGRVIRKNFDVAVDVHDCFVISIGSGAKVKFHLGTPLPPPVFSEQLIAWLDNFSQSATIDMGEGGDDAECVAECCMTMIDMPYHRKQGDVDIAEEVRRLTAVHGLEAVMAESAKHVRTL